MNSFLKWQLEMHHGKNLFSVREKFVRIQTLLNIQNLKDVFFYTTDMFMPRV